MAFITFNGGGSSEHHVREGHYGLSVEQWLESSEVDEFAADIATFIDKDWSYIKRYIRHRAQFDTSYEDMTDLADDIYAWWVIKKVDFTKIKSALTASYDPIENYRRTRSGYESKINGSISDVGSNNTSNGDSTTENESAPYDQATYHKDNKSHTTYSEDVDISNTKTYSDLQTDVNITDAGNVGVTTNQQMINEEVSLRLANNLLKLITDELIKDFCIPLYN